MDMGTDKALVVVGGENWVVVREVSWDLDLESGLDLGINMILYLVLLRAPNGVGEGKPFLPVFYT